MKSHETSSSNDDGGNRIWLVLGCILAGLSVALGAFGAHGLESRIDVWYPDPDDSATRLANWETAARYQMYHALGLIALGLLAQRRMNRSINVAGSLLLAGTCIFSGCLYMLVLTDARVLGAIVPIGGTLQLVGWGWFAFTAARRGAS